MIKNGCEVGHWGLFMLGSSGLGQVALVIPVLPTSMTVLQQMEAQKHWGSVFDRDCCPFSAQTDKY